MPDNIVITNDLQKEFGTFRAVSQLSFQIRAGEIFTLLGQNGAGKTTTLKMLMGILRSSGGTATIFGMDCFSKRPEIMAQTGYMPDEPNFHDYLTGMEILRFSGAMRGFSPAETEIRCLKLVERLNVDGDLAEYAANYSHGMKKKLAAILAFFHEPSFLLLDEPTNGLDPYATRELHLMIQARAEEGCAVLLTTHLLNQAEKLCTRIGILKQGRLIAEGSVEELNQQLQGALSLEDVFFKMTEEVA